MSNTEKSKSWSEFIMPHPEAHLLQSPAWGELKASFGWYAREVTSGNAGAQVLFRPLPFGFKLGYIPRGPIGAWLPDLLPALDDLCIAEGAFMLKVEPDHDEDQELGNRLESSGFKASRQSIQPPRTILIDIRDEEESLLARMKQKTRYNIRLAGRKGVTVRPWDDIEGFAAMSQETAERDAFGVHNRAYFQEAYDLFRPSGSCELLVAEVEGEPVAALMVFAHGTRAWYLYGASRSAHREKMPTYLLQWEAIRWAKEIGCQTYDLWGIPDADEETLEAQFSSRSDGLWGVYRFKRGFGGKVTRTIGAWDRIYSSLTYRLYSLASRIRGGGGSV